MDKALSVHKIMDASWTPGRKDVPKLCSLWENFSEDERGRLGKKLQNLDKPAAMAGLMVLTRLSGCERFDLTRVILKAALKSIGCSMQLDEIARLRSVCLELLSKPEPRLRKSVAQALGSSWSFLDTKLAEELSEKLKSCFLAASDKSELKAINDALGKCGQKSALDVLVSRSNEVDRSSSSKAILKLKRDLAGGVSDPTATCLPENISERFSIVLWFTPGVESVALQSSSLLGAKQIASGILVSDSLTWAELGNIFLWRKAGFLLGMQKDQNIGRLIDLLVLSSEAIKSSTMLTIQRPVRIRLGRSSKFSRQNLWEFAQQLEKVNCGLINDGRNPDWELDVIDDHVVLIPRNYKDQRFYWRNAGVEGSSDPTIAAAIVEFANILSGDVVYDPFCGAATELILANKISKAKKLIGADTSAVANLAAMCALDHAKVSADIVHADGNSFPGGPYDVIITNPPFGIRTTRGQAREVIQKFFHDVSKKITKGARIVMLSHAPSSTRLWAHQAGFKLHKFTTINLGRMPCELQCFMRS